MDVITSLLTYIFIGVIGVAIISLIATYIIKRYKYRKQIEKDNEQNTIDKKDK